MAEGHNIGLEGVSTYETWTTQDIVSNIEEALRIAPDEQESVVTTDTFAYTQEDLALIIDKTHPSTTQLILLRQRRGGQETWDKHHYLAKLFYGNDAPAEVTVGEQSYSQEDVLERTLYVAKMFLSQQRFEAQQAEIPQWQR